MISVIIPVYKAKEYIIRCLDSVMAQDYDDYELVIVDDCGNDRSIDIATSYLNQLFDGEWKIVHHEMNRGLSAARNSGIQHAKGDFVFFLDADDTIPCDCLSSLNSVVDEDVDFSMGRYANVPFHELQYEFCNSILNQRELIDCFIKWKLPWNAVNRVIRRDFILNHNLLFKEGLLSEDLLWNFSLLPYVSKVAVIDKTTYYYHVNQGSIMHSVDFNYKYTSDLVSIVGEMKSISMAISIPELTKYFLSIKYYYLPNAILWHRYPNKFRYSFLKRLLEDRFQFGFASLPIDLRLLFLLPSDIIVLLKMLKFKFIEYWHIIKYKIGLS